jgi:DNA (cytosine-5)-methyltransferase 1
MMICSDDLNEMLRGLPVGAFVVERPKTNSLVELLRSHGLLKRGRNVTQIAGEQQHEPQSTDAHLLAVHVAGWPSETLMRQVLSSAMAVRFVPWYRVRPPVPPPQRPAAAAAARFTFVELFAGIGMFRVGLQRIGGACVFASEIAPPARKVYERNFGDVPEGDITEYPAECIPPHDVLTAGFPCQSFSKAGDQDGLRCPKGQLFLEVLRILTGKRPKAFLLENVANLAAMDGGATMDTVVQALQHAGYTVAHSVINSNTFVPQDRQRLYIVGWNAVLYPSKHPSEFPWTRCDAAEVAPAGGASRKRLRDVLSVSHEEEEHLRLTPAQWRLVVESPRFQVNPAWRMAALDGVARTLMGSYKSSYQLYSEFVPIERSFDGPQRASPSSSSTQTPSAENEDVPVRFFSVLECARLQGIPDDFVFDVSGVHHNAAYRMIGNAVCPIVVGAIAKVLVDWVGIGSSQNHVNP